MDFINVLEDIALAERNEPVGIDEQQTLDIQHINQRLDMLDQRLDNIDSIVTALVERVMKQPVTVEVVCPKCGSRVQIMLTSSTKVMTKE